MPSSHKVKSTATLILMRHGQSVWNQQNLFTGWVDVPLSEKGIEEALKGGKKIRNEPIDLAFTSSLNRAHMTLVLALLHHASGKIPVFQHKGKLASWGRIYNPEVEEKIIPVYQAAELNERMYGTLQGLNKKETAKRYGEEKVHQWRRSFDEPPPKGESLAMTAARTIPYFQETIVPHLKQGKNIFIAAHGNSLRSIVMHLEKMKPKEVLDLEIPTGEPLLYLYEKGKWNKK